MHKFRARCEGCNKDIPASSVLDTLVCSDCQRKGVTDNRLQPRFEMFCGGCGCLVITNSLFSSTTCGDCQSRGR